MDIKIIKKLNKDKKQYIALVVDLGYAQKPLSFNPQDIAEICGLAVRELYERLDDGIPMIIGEINL